MEKKERNENEELKKTYTAPAVESEEVLEQAALACSGIFPNSQWDYKDNEFSCGFNDS